MDNRSVFVNYLEKARQEKRHFQEHEVLALMDTYKLPVPSYKFIPADSAISYKEFEKINYPLVIKVVSKNIVHKSDAGGVRLNLKNAAEVKSAIEEMSISIPSKVAEAKIDGWLIMSYISKGIELIAGSITDSQFGASVMVGIGGIFTEAYKDVSFRQVPLDFYDVIDMLSELKGQAILDGLRTGNTLNRKAFANFFVAFSKLIIENPEIEECDLNPVICIGESIMIADARLKIKES